MSDTPEVAEDSAPETAIDRFRKRRETAAMMVLHHRQSAAAQHAQAEKYAEEVADLDAAIHAMTVAEDSFAQRGVRS